jgi:hypothetical protein
MERLSVLFIRSCAGRLHLAKYPVPLSPQRRLRRWCRGSIRRTSSLVRRWLRAQPIGLPASSSSPGPTTGTCKHMTSGSSTSSGRPLARSRFPCLSTSFRSERWCTRALRGLTFRVNYSTDVRSQVVRVQVFRRGRQVWASSRTKTLPFPTDAGTEFFTWALPPRIKRGARLAVVATLSGSGYVSRRAIAVNAP